MTDEELIAKFQARVADGEIDLRPFGELIFGKFDQDWPARLIALARRGAAVCQIPAGEITDLDLAKIKEAAERATPGPWDTDTIDNEDGKWRFKSYIVGSGPVDNWKAVVDTSNSDVIEIHREDDIDYSSVWDEQGRRNAEFIALARTTVPALIARIEASEHKNKRLLTEIIAYKVEIRNLRRDNKTAYAEGVEAAAAIHTAEVARLEKQIEENIEYMRRVGRSDHSANNHCHEKLRQHLYYAEAIRSLLKDKPNG